MGFTFLEIIPTQLPNPTHFFGFFWVGLTEFYGLTQPLNTPGLNSEPYIYYVLFLPTELSSRGPNKNIHKNKKLKHG